MRRFLMLLVSAFLVYAQIDDGLSDDASKTGVQAGEVGSSGDDSFLDELIENSSSTQTPAETSSSDSQPVQIPPAQTPPEPSMPAEEMPSESYESQSGEKPSNEAPLRDEGVKTSTTPDINVAVVQESPEIPQFSHAKHLNDVGAECVQCHQTLFSETVRGYRSGPSMKEICSQCHNGTDAPAEVLAGFSDEKKYVKTHMPRFSHTKHINHTEDCNTCHKDIFGELKNIRIPPPMRICSGCHNNGRANADCRVCHEDPSRLRPADHTSRWGYRNGHGLHARYNQAQCRDCHADRQCSLCHRGHGSFSVHRSGYKYSHGMDARQRQVNCSYCHDLENSCAKCHTRTR